MRDRIHLVAPGQSGARPDRGRIVPLTWPIRVLVFPLLLSSLSKRALGFAFLRGGVNGVLGGALLGVAVLLGLVLAWPLGWGAYALSAWLLGIPGVLLILNAATPGFVFIRPFCSPCELAPIILRHEFLHLRGLARERDIWVALRHEFGSDASRFKAQTTICNHCPIPSRLAAVAEHART